MNSESRNQPLRQNRESADAVLHEGGSGLALSDIVALNDTGQLDPLLPPIATGPCGWCRGYGLVRDIGGLLCQSCFSIAIEIMRAMVAGDTDAYAVLIKKLDSRKRITGETIH